MNKTNEIQKLLEFLNHLNTLEAKLLIGIKCPQLSEDMLKLGMSIIDFKKQLKGYLNRQRRDSLLIKHDFKDIGR